MKISLLLFPATLAVLTLSCCHRRNVEPQFAEYAVDTVVQCGVVPCDLSCRFETIANADRSEALAAIENANVNYCFGLEDFMGPVSEAAATFIERFAADYACDTLYRPDMRYTLNVSAEASVRDTLIIYRIRQESYTGGAHGMRSTRYHNYGIKGGYELSLSDLFSEEELPQLTERIKTKLYEQYGATNDEELAQRGFFPSMVAPTENFEITPTGVVFHYDPYEVACYAVGEVDVPFTKEELSLR